MASVRRPALLLSAALLGSAAIGFEPAIRRDVAVGEGAHRLSIGAVRVPLWSAAFAQEAGTVSLDDVTITLGPSTYTIKRIEFSGVTSSRAEIQAVFDKGATEPLSARLARLGAKRISIPELVGEEAIGPTKQRTTYRNVVATDVSGGRIGTVTAESGVSEVTGPSGKSTIRQGRAEATELDLAAIVRIFTEKGGTPATPLTKVEGGFSVQDIAFSDERATMKIARIAGRDFSIRPTEESWAGTLSLMTAIGELDQPSDEETWRMVTALLDAVDASEVGFMEVAGIEMVIREPKSDPFAFNVKRVAYTGAASGRPSEVVIEGAEMRVPEGALKVASVSYSGFSFQPTLQGLRALKGKPLDQLDPAAIRTLIPTIGTFRYSGLDIDILNKPDKDKKDAKPERVRATLGEAELTADKPVNGIPTNIRTAVRNFVFAIPLDTKDEELKTVQGLGYKTLDLSYSLAATWNEAGREIPHEFSFNGVEMGQVAFKGVIGNVTRDVFDTDLAVAAAAALGATAKSAELVVENTGLFERFLQVEARKQKKTPEAVRREYAAAAAVAVPAMLGNSEQAKAVGQAVARFVAKPTRLRITARAKSPAGLGLSDVMAESDPAAILNKLDITAVTEERL